MKKIGVVSLGCPKNLVDSEIMLGILKDDYEVTNSENEADILIVNTCGFIESAKQESINTILEMAKHKQEDCELLIVTGCMAERYREQIIEQIPEVDAVLGTGNYEEIAEVIKKAYKGDKTISYGKLNELGYLEKERVVSSGKGYAYLKIAEGCDNCCTYCIIPSLRGSFRSRKIEDIIKEAGILANNGIKEIILVAQDTTRYGIDIYGDKKLVELIGELSKISGISWIRLLYCYPEEIDEALINEIANNPKVLNYLDIPIQHASDRILKMMGRRGTLNQLEDKLDMIREKIPDIVIRTSIIVGFPGETQEDFEILSEFINRYEFDNLGVFTYSREEDTPAAKMKNQISKKLKEERFGLLMEQQQRIVSKKNDNRIGNIYKALVEGVAEDGIFYFGRSYAQAPDIDGKIYFTSGEPLEMGQFVHIKILNIDDYDLIGEVVNEFTE